MHKCLLTFYDLFITQRLMQDINSTPDIVKVTPATKPIVTKNAGSSTSVPLDDTHCCDVVCLMTEFEAVEISVVKAGIVT